MKTIVATLIICGILIGCSPKQARNFNQPPEAIPVVASDSIAPEGTVVVKICVNWKGDVLSTEYLEKQSDTRDTTLINKAIRAAKVYKFEERQGSPIQCGTIKFNFFPKDKQ